MHTRVKVEWKSGAAGNYGFVTTDHPQSSNGRPVLVIKGQAYSAEDLTALGGTIVTADKELMGALERLGYQVRHSNPQRKWKEKNVVFKTVELTKKEDAALERKRKKVSMERGEEVTAYAVLLSIIRAGLEDEMED